MSSKKTGQGPLHIFKILLFPAVFSLFFSACQEHQSDVTHKEIVETPEQINARAEEVIQGTLKEVLKNSRDLGDSFRLRNADVVQVLYDKYSFQPLWSARGQFNVAADSLFRFIDSARLFGLFPEDYYQVKLGQLKNQLIGDTASREKKLDAAVWAYSDMLLTSAFVQIVKDLKIGRLLPDSVIAKDSTLTPEFYIAQLTAFKSVDRDSFARRLEPSHSAYIRLRTALREFLDSADFHSYTYIAPKDSSQIPALVYQRIAEEDSSVEASPSPDSAAIALAVRTYQKDRGLKVDGKVTNALVNRLNDNDRERFLRIAINLDRFKQLPPLPSKYIWVNLPSFYLQLRDSDTVVLKSRVVVGKPLTKTPIITSAISDMITYPKWTIPESIIKKEILPGLKKDPGYTLARGYSIVDTSGNEVDPFLVKWARYKDYIPYKVVQGSGDDNALGVLKFNFPNKYSVYLHDTNQRYLFSKSSRALSHGCVRVQAWEQLATYILRNDSVYSINAVKIDSLKSWLATKQKRYIPVRKPIPLFIRYFTCDASEGKLAFYEDIYGEDRKFREKLITAK